MKIKFENKTNSIFWMGDFCFAPNSITIIPVLEEQKKKLEEIKKNNSSIKAAFGKKIFAMEFKESFEEEPEKEETIKEEEKKK